MALASDPDADLDQKKKALRHAKKAMRLSKMKSPGYARTLSKLYAMLGDNSKATAWRIYALRVAMAKEDHIKYTRLEDHFNHGRKKQCDCKDGKCVHKKADEKK